MGRGIRSILESDENVGATEDGILIELPLQEIQPNPNQPRKLFDSVELDELAASIRAKGILQPIVVQRLGTGRYQIIAGERRWKASALAGLERIPAVVRTVEGKAEELVLAVVENVQRSDLDAIEKARAFQKLSTEFQMTQDEVARIVGMNRASIANFIRLLELPEDIQQLVSFGHLKMGHARAILGVDETDVQRAIAAEVVKKALSVRATEELVNHARTSVLDREEKGNPRSKPEWVKEKEKDLGTKLGTKVRIRHSSQGSGELILRYADENALDRLIGQLSTGAAPAR